MAGKAVPPKVDTSNEWLIREGQNLPNHSESLKGRGKFLRQNVDEFPTFRTRQAAYRYGAWLMIMAEVLPDEEHQEGVTFDQVVEAIKNGS